MPKPERQRRKISHVLLRLNQRDVKLTFAPDGVHLREKHAHEESITNYERLAKMILASRARYTNALAIELDITAENLHIFASLIEAGETPRQTLLEIEEHTRKTLKMVRAKILLSAQS